MCCERLLIRIVAPQAWDDQPMRNNEGTFLEIASVYRRYYCPISRMVYLGKPSEKFLKSEK